MTREEPLLVILSAAKNLSSLALLTRDASQARHDKVLGFYWALLIGAFLVIGTWSLGLSSIQVVRDVVQVADAARPAHRFVHHRGFVGLVADQVAVGGTGAADGRGRHDGGRGSGGFGRGRGAGFGAGAGVVVARLALFAGAGGAAAGAAGAAALGLGAAAFF